MKRREKKKLLMDFLKFHYRKNPFRKVTTNNKEVDEYLQYKIDEEEQFNNTVVIGRRASGVM